MDPTGKFPSPAGVPDKMPPDKMPPTVEFVFIFFKCCFSLLLHALNVAANCVNRIKIDLNIIIIS